MKLYVVTGEGPNGLQIPLVPFLSKEKAVEFIAKFPKHLEGENVLDYDFSELEGIYRDDEDDECQSALGKPLYEALFKNGSYYPGCGGVYALVILEVTPGQPMVSWDLD